MKATGRFGRALRLGALMIGLPVALVTACDDEGEVPCFCTEEFRFVAVQVVDTTGAPADSVEITVTQVATGTEIEVDQIPSLDAGTYVIFSDAQRLSIADVDGDDIRVDGVKDGLSFSEVFVIGLDSECRCHVLRVSGPTLVSLQP